MNDNDIGSKQLAKMGVVEATDGEWLMASQLGRDEAEVHEHEEAEAVVPAPATKVYAALSISA